MATSDQETLKIMKSDSSRLSAVRSCTLKEYNQQISDLRKENFSLKMRIYFMEERMQQKFGDGQDVFKMNIELQMEIDILKRELMDKQVLVQKAAHAIDTLTSKHAQEEETTKNQLQREYEETIAQLRDQLDKANLNCESIQKEVEDAKRELETLKHQLYDANTQLAYSNQANEDLSSRMKIAEIHTQALTAQLKSSEQAKAEISNENVVLTKKLNHLEDQLQEACKKCSNEGREGKEKKIQKQAIMRKDGQFTELEEKLKDKKEVTTIEHLKTLMELLQTEISSLATLHLHPECLDNPDEGVSAEVLLTQISSAQQIYKQLKEGLDKSNQLHQALVNCLSTEQGHYAISVNSLQDREYNQESSHCHSKLKRLSNSQDLEQTGSESLLQISTKCCVQFSSLPSLSGRDSSSTNQSVAVQVCPSLIDRSQQAGINFSHINQLKTSPRHGESHENFVGEKKRSNHRHDQDAISVSADHIPVSRSKNYFVDSKDDFKCKDMIRHHSNSMTDDTKDEFLGKCADNLQKYHNFQHDIFFDDDHFDYRRHDMASSMKFDSLHVPSIERTNSEHISPSSSTKSSCGSKEAHSDVLHLYHHGNNEHSIESHVPDLMKVSCSNGAGYCDEPDGNCFPGVNIYSENATSCEKNCENVNLHPQVPALPPASKNEHLNQELLSSGKCISVLHTHSGDGGDFCDSKYFKTAMSPKCLPIISSNSSASSQETKPVRNVDYSKRSRKKLAVNETAERKVTAVTNERTGENFSHEELQQNGVYTDKHDESLDQTKSEHQSKSDLRHIHHLHQQPHNSKNRLSCQYPLSVVIPEMCSVELKSNMKTPSDLVGAASQKPAFQKHLESSPNSLDRQLFRNITPLKNKKLTAVSGTSRDLHQKLSESYCKIKDLEKKLQATENTVRLFSKKNKAYLSVMKANGLSVSLMNRSNSETCLDSFSRSLRTRASSVGNLSSWTCGQESPGYNSVSAISHEAESIERARSHFCSTFQSVNITCHSSSAPSLMATPCATAESSPDAITRSLETSNSNTTQPCFNNLDLTMSQNSSSQMNSLVNIMKNNQLGTSSSVVNVTKPMPVSMYDTVMTSPADNLFKKKTSDDEYLSPASSHKSPTQHSIHSHKSPEKHASLDPDQSSLKLSVTKQSPNVTYSSILNNTVMNQLFLNLEQNLSSPREGTLHISGLGVEQLQIRLEHSERVNLALKEEIGIYEALHHLQKTGVSPNLDEKFSSSIKLRGKEISENLLTQHLTEIRKLRQRLERLDVAIDSDQLLIFQSHTCHRISRQEMLIAQLQQEMLEKEQQWQRELSELQHKLCREKTLLVEKLELTISELKTTIANQAETIKEQERQVLDLKSELNVETCKRNKKVGDKKRGQKIKADIMKEDNELLDKEESVFNLELANSNSPSENSLESETEETDRRLQMEQREESLVYPKGQVGTCKTSLQETIALLQKQINETTATDYRLEERQGQMKNVVSELDILRKELQELKAGLEDRAELKTEVNILKEQLKKIENLKALTELQKMEQKEVMITTEENIKLTAQLESESDEKGVLKLQINKLEHTLAEKMTLENQLSELKEELKSVSRLQHEIDRLNIKLNHKNKQEEEVRDNLQSLVDLQLEVKMLREKLANAEVCRRVTEEMKKNVLANLKEREGKLRTREKQLHHLLGQYKKLDAAFTKQQHTLQEKMDLIQSMKKQIHLYEISLTCSGEEKDSNMKQLLKELISARAQLEDLLTRLEHTSAELKLPVYETTASRRTEQELHPTSTLTSNSSPLSSYQIVLPSQGTLTKHSSRQIKLLVDSAHTNGTIPHTYTASSVHSLVAVLKQDCHEKLHRHVGECLAILTSMEETLEDKLGMFEGVEYSTIRDTFLSCERLQIYLKEAAHLISAAWVTELSPNDIKPASGPVLSEHDKFRNKREYLSSQNEAPDRSVNNQQEKQKTSSNHKAWETILYRQLYKTAQNLEQARKNFDSSLASLPPPPLKN